MTNYPKEFWDYVQNSERIGTDYAMGLFDLGKKHRDTGDWHGLTAAIKAGEPIDWEALDGRRAKCKHSSGIEVYHKFERDPNYDADTPSGQHDQDGEPAWDEAFRAAWKGRDWTLYIDGPVPLKRKTADQLAPGTCIRNADGVLGIIYEDAEGIKGFWGADHKALLAEEVEVQTEYGIGTFQEQS